MFPSLVIGKGGIEARGAFAEAQAAFLEPDRDEVKRVESLLRETNAGVVAHFYMDPELQGVLAAVEHPHVHVADSLQMAEHAVKMAAAGAKAIVVLGVDFMSENVRATLDSAGFADVLVLRACEDRIGCSLAEAAEAPAYGAFLEQARKTPRSLHVIYVNTSLHVKGMAESMVPTVTCTSSNVVRTVLEAAADVPNGHVWFGPDTYMGHNLASLLQTLAVAGDEAVAQVHPRHDTASIEALRARFHPFEQGVCIVHHMFGQAVTERVQRDYADAFVTAHFEVPGEMFRVALEAQGRGRGVVGSTSNILEFIGKKTALAAEKGGADRLVFVLGTEAGMITSIVRHVRAEIGTSNVEVEIVFPVADEAVARTDDVSLPVVPGAASGEGCSVEGGCATCPYMKMNSLDALERTLGFLRAGDQERLEPLEAKRGSSSAGIDEAALATRTIARMRHFQKEGSFPDELIAAITGRTSQNHDRTDSRPRPQRP